MPQLVVRQQPQRAQISGAGRCADHRPIDPPVIVQVVGHAVPCDAHPPFRLARCGGAVFFVRATLAKVDTDKDVPWLEDGTTQSSTSGTSIALVRHLRDIEHGNARAAFAAFSEISVRIVGAFRLRLALYEIGSDTRITSHGSVFSHPFAVSASKPFVVMEASSRLACSLAKQSLKMRIRNDRRPRTLPRDYTPREAQLAGAPEPPTAAVRADPAMETAAAALVWYLQSCVHLH